jgi:hypothetical protein
VVQFNKFMNLAEVVQGKVTCEGFVQPVYVLLQQGPSLRKTGAFSDILAFEIANSPWGTVLVPYEVGKTYTITIDSTLRDVNGNMLGRKYCFSFLAEPYFRVVGVDPPNGSTELVNLLGGIQPRITSNSKLMPSFLNNVQLMPALVGRWRLSYDSTSVEFTNDSLPAFATLYSMTVSQNARDKFGNLIRAGYRSTFATAAFKVISTTPRDGDMMSDLRSPISFTFSGPVDSRTLLESILFTPPISGVLSNTLGGGSIVSFTPDNGWVGGKQYRATVSTGVRATNGAPLSLPSTLRFSTALFGVISTSPSDGETNVPVDQRIYVYFNNRILPIGISSAFSIQPSIPGQVSTVPNGTHIQFIPYPGFTIGTTYTVRIGTSLRVPNGDSLSSPFTFSFSTRPFRVVQTFPSNGEENFSMVTGIQVNFSDPIDTGSVRSAFSVVPNVPGGFSMIPGDSFFIFGPTRGWRGGTIYTVSIGPSMRAANGGTLGTEYRFSFKTVPFMVTQTYPDSGETGVSRRVTLQIRFNSGLDTTSLPRGFTISPYIPGFITGYSGFTSFYFYSTSLFYARTTYTVTVGTAIRSLAGDSLATPYIFPFTTGLD